MTSSVNCSRGSVSLLQEQFGVAMSSLKSARLALLFPLQIKTVWLFQTAGRPFDFRGVEGGRGLFNVLSNFLLILFDLLLNLLWIDFNTRYSFKLLSNLILDLLSFLSFFFV
jgi:hypothetical protein